MTLTDFLLARIAEDDAAARAIETGAWEDAVSTSRRFDHVDRWSPARVLAECEAKRQIAEQAWVEYVEANREFGGAPFDFKGLLADGQSPEVVRLLALPYADHPDYDERWRP